LFQAEFADGFGGKVWVISQNGAREPRPIQGGASGGVQLREGRTGKTAYLHFTREPGDALWYRLGENFLSPFLGTIDVSVQVAWQADDGRRHILVDLRNRSRTGYVLEKKPDGTLSFSSQEKEKVLTELTAPAAALCDGGWHHVRAVWNTAGFALLLDGKKRAESTDVLVPSSVCKDLFVGSCYEAVDQLEGAVAELRIWLGASAAGAACLGDSRVQFAVVGEDQRPLPCRIHVKDKAGTPRYAQGFPRWNDHFVCPGTAELQIPAGEYVFEIERGPEYRRESGAFRLEEGQTRQITLCLKRLADLAAKGWFSGELHVHRSVDEVPLLMEAEDLHVCPVITWWNDQNIWKSRRAPAEFVTRLGGDRLLDVMAGEDERGGGALLYFRLAKPLAVAGSSREYPCSMRFLQEARRHPGAWIDIEKPFWWDVPLWLASGGVDSIGLANNHMCRSGMSETEAWGKPRDTVRLPPPRGNGYWSQELYYHVLNCGLRVPPSAGSASGVLPNPVGYNRVYVFLGRELTYDGWWQGLKAGRSFVSNGPLLLVRADGQLPGQVFTAPEGATVVVHLEAQVISSDRIPALEVVKNGRVEQRIPPAQLAHGPLTVTFQRSGWFLLRAIADVPATFRFASTAPYYVEIGQSKRLVSRSSVRFFLDWLDERAGRVSRALADPTQAQEVLSYYPPARQFWQKLLAQANAP
jgi:hypothetical protein